MLAGREGASRVGEIAHYILFVWIKGNGQAFLGVFYAVLP
jgi:hypothetical protein